MDFFQSQEVARRKTSVLVAYFMMAVVLIVGAVYLALAAIFMGAAVKSGVEQPVSLWNATLFLWVAGLTVALVACGSLYKMAALSGGGETVARMLGGQPIAPDTTDPRERRVHNVVEEMAIASGTPVPPVFLLPDAAINAFAAGFTPGDAVIGVTRGCVDRLSRDELQGVVAHEFSHILNGDMRLNIRLMGVLHGILVLALIGYALLRTTAFSSSRSSSRKGGNPLPLVGLALLIIGYVGVFFGKLIKSAVSRQREFLADASAVQFTRNPDGIAGALKKIGGLSRGSRLSAAHAEEASHLFFANGVKASFANLLATHPPLDERIRRIDPAFDGRFAQPAEAAPPQARPHAAAAGFAGGAAAAPPAPPPLPAERLLEHIGAPRPEHVAHAARLLAGLPRALDEAAREPFGARAVVYAQLLDADETVRASQLRGLRDRADEAVLAQLDKLLPHREALPAQSRLPLVDLALPALRNLSPNQYMTFRANVTQLVEADKAIDLFEYALQRILLRHLDPVFGQARPPRKATHTMRDALEPLTDLLSTLAYYGHDDIAAAERAFARGAAALQCGMALAVRPPEACGLALADEALNAIQSVAPPMRRRILTACAACVASDGNVTIEEAELLRAIADTLDCPMPPLL